MGGSRKTFFFSKGCCPSFIAGPSAALCRCTRLAKPMVDYAPRVHQRRRRALGWGPRVKPGILSNGSTSNLPDANGGGTRLQLTRSPSRRLCCTPSVPQASYALLLLSLTVRHLLCAFSLFSLCRRTDQVLDQLLGWNLTVA